MQNRELLSIAAKEVREFAKAGLKVDSFGRRLQLLEKAKVLNDLPAVKAAGPNATARFEYLAQAINDAIDDLSHTDGEIPGRVNGHQAEASALRQLFGLTEQTRRASWRVRQEAAAGFLHMSWEHFRHGRQDMLLRALTERLLADAESNTAGAAHFPGPFTAFPPQAEVEADIVSFIHSHRPARADLLELSTATTLPIIRALYEVKADVRLLVANPATLLSTPFMAERIRRSLAELTAEFADCQALNVRVYNVPPSLRGRSIGSLIAVGWYTYRDNKRLDLAEGDTTEIWGHDNAMVVGQVSDANGAKLSAWFGREFDRLWAHRLTTDSSVLDGQL
jgi:hypothetical protein